MSRVKGVILCGGEGKRLRPLTYYFQKAMLPIGPRHRPALEYVIRLMQRHGIDDVALLVGYKQQQVSNYFKDGESLGVKLSYVQDDPNLRGNGGSLLNAYLKKELDENQDVLVYYGDILSNIDLTGMMKLLRDKKAAAVLAVVKGYKVPVGVVELGNDNMIIDFVEKPIINLSVGVGVLALKGEVLIDLMRIGDEKKNIDLMGDLLPDQIGKGRGVYAYVTDAFWYDMGSTESYEKLEDSVVAKYLDTI